MMTHWVFIMLCVVANSNKYFDELMRPPRFLCGSFRKAFRNACPARQWQSRRTEVRPMGMGENAHHRLPQIAI